MNLPEIEISVSFKGSKKSELTKVTSSADIATVCRQIFNADKINWVEEFVLICLNSQNVVIGWYKVSQGGMQGTIADPRVIYQVALKTLATTIVVAHNHQSGCLKPSLADRQTTTKLREAGAILGIGLVDHLIITDESYYSFADEGLL